MKTYEKCPVTFQYDGQTVTVEFAAQMRGVIIWMRNEALRQTEFGWAVRLSHTVATFNCMAAHIWGKDWEDASAAFGPLEADLPFTPLIEELRTILAQVTEVIRPFAATFGSTRQMNSLAYSVVPASSNMALGLPISFTDDDIKAAKDFVTWFDNGLNNPPLDLSKPRGEEGGFKLQGSVEALVPQLKLPRIIVPIERSPLSPGNYDLVVDEIASDGTILSVRVV